MRLTVIPGTAFQELPQPEGKADLRSVSTPEPLPAPKLAICVPDCEPDELIAAPPKVAESWYVTPLGLTTKY